MTKIQFLLALGEKLSALPKNEIEERLNFYSEMIEDRMEEGLTEEEAVAAVGDIDEIAKGILAEYPQIKYKPAPTPEEKPKRKLAGWEIALLILGIPVWLPLISAVFVVGLSLNVSALAVIISLWSAFFTLGVSSVYLLVIGITYLFGAKALTGVALIGGSLICAGLTVFAFYGCLALSKLIIKLTVWIFKLIKGLFTKKEAA